MKHYIRSAFLLLLVVGTSACAGNVDDEMVTVSSPIPGRLNESIAVRAFYSGYSLRQIVVVERNRDNGFFSHPTGIRIATRDLWNANTEVTRDFSFHWQTPDSLIIRSPHLSDMLLLVSKNTLIGGRETYEPR